MPEESKGQPGCSKWMNATGPDGEIVLSSRVRLARNIREVPFPYLASDSQADDVTRQIRQASSELQDEMGKMRFFPIKNIPPLERQVLVEKHLISPLLIKEPHNSAVLLRSDEAVSVMVNEEDHLRIQCLLPGLQLEQGLAEANRYDDLLEEKLAYAYDEQWGYLTACPTNVGTGLRASVMVHLPALVLTKQINRVLSAIAQVGLAVRGLYGEGSEVVGNLVQISNQITLGQSEDEIVRNLYGVSRQIVEQEAQARQILLNEGRDRIADRVNRAFGVLSHARLMSSQEAMQLLSDVRLGIDLGLIEEVSGNILKELMVLLRPACLQMEAGRELDSLDRNRERAGLIRKRLESHYQ
ncbi:protein arginine kinase [Dethiobacter alkaliphilus]|uniref:protein arginine kinase n=1 Tax=Dethiobacter alkaliphilus TaxID=427926 RepID=UPI0022272B89|nr:protein arginine kinase [Dethiobacter alkaliphilus]MCW3491431.1 protein arginine kinase [Dethiobacter alkaliphilus]